MAENTEKPAAKASGESLVLSMHWTDEEGWAGTKGKRYLPLDKVTFENPHNAHLLRDAGYEALDV